MSGDENNLQLPHIAVWQPYLTVKIAHKVAINGSKDRDIGQYGVKFNREVRRILIEKCASS